MSSMSVYAGATTAVFYIEGPTGVGKSTLLELIGRNMPNVSTMYEPVEQFIDMRGNGNILDLYFSNPDRWCFAAQIGITLVRAKAIKEHLAVSTASVAIIDRSLYADLYVFGNMGYSTGQMTALEWFIYKEFCVELERTFQSKPKGFIYLQASPQAVYARVQERARVEEAAMPLQFQIDLDHYYRAWLIDKKDIAAQHATIPVLVIDALQNYKSDAAMQSHVVALVRAFVDQHSRSDTAKK